MKQKEIKVLMVAPGEHPREVVLKNDLDALQKAVSIGCDYQGLIEVVGLGDGVCIICNEEGKLLGLEGNRRLGGDIIAGVFYVVKGENNVELRERVCSDMDFLGIKIDTEINKQTVRKSEAVKLSTDDSKVLVYMIPTNEELMIARDTEALVKAKA